MAGEVTRVPDLSWFTAEVQNDIIEAAKFGLKVKWVALKCGVNPKALVAILDTGARRDAPPELRRFFRRWMDGKTALMSELHERWVRGDGGAGDRKSTRLNSSHLGISYAVFCLKKKTQKTCPPTIR